MNKTYIGQKFNRLTIIAEPYLKKYGNQQQSFVKCKCDCGIILDVRLYNLKNDIPKSCGCLKREKAKQICIKRNTTHNLSNHPLYIVWSRMKDRCYNSKNSNYHRYGGRGIIICDEWKNNFKSFYDWAIQNGWKKGLSIDRINNENNYEPNNCRFVNMQIQANNTSINNLIEAFGEIKSASEWERDKRCKVHRKTLTYRINNDWNPEKAIITPAYN